jgi:hypothetical protein
MRSRFYLLDMMVLRVSPPHFFSVSFQVSNKMRLYGNSIETKGVINIPGPAVVPVRKRRLRRYPPIRSR